MTLKQNAWTAFSVIAPLTIASVGLVVLAALHAAPWSTLAAVVMALTVYFAFVYLRLRATTRRVGG
jgi:hypothetical protein